MCAPDVGHAIARRSSFAYRVDHVVELAAGVCRRQVIDVVARLDDFAGPYTDDEDARDCERPAHVRRRSPVLELRHDHLWVGGLVDSDVGGGAGERSGSTRLAEMRSQVAPAAERQ